MHPLQDYLESTSFPLTDVKSKTFLNHTTIPAKGHSQEFHPDTTLQWLSSPQYINSGDKGSALTVVQSKSILSLRPYSADDLRIAKKETVNAESFLTQLEDAYYTPNIIVWLGTPKVINLGKSIVMELMIQYSHDPRTYWNADMYQS